MAMSDAELEAPSPSAVPLLFAEEITVGAHFDFGTYVMTADEIAEFGAKWDPLPLHLSEGDAEGTAFGRLVASGVHTMAVFQRLSVISAFSTWDIFAGRRLDDVKLLSPVFPEDALTGGLDVRAIDFNYPSRALVTCFGWLSTERGRVLELVTESYVNRRP
jgi:acyl dehydratase